MIIERLKSFFDDDYTLNQRKIIINIAIDNIEALRAENARLQAELAAYKSNGIIVASDYRALQVENGRLLQLLDEALEGYEDCMSYKSEYLVEKHGDKEEVARIRAAMRDSND